MSRSHLLRKCSKVESESHLPIEASDVGCCSYIPSILRRAWIKDSSCDRSPKGPLSRSERGAHGPFKFQREKDFFPWENDNGTPFSFSFSFSFPFSLSLSPSTLCLFLFLCVFLQACTSSDSESKRVSRSKSKATVCQGEEKPDDSSWKKPIEGGDVNASCKWECDEGHKANTQGSACIVQEEVTRFRVKNLVSHPDGANLEGFSSRDLVVEIDSVGVSQWYVTSDSKFRPKSPTDPAGIKWRKGNPQGNQNYKLLGNVPEGEVTLYLWMVDEEGVVNKNVTASETFTLDVSPPTLSSIRLPASDKLVAGEENALFGLTVSGVDTYSKYEYCFGKNCNSLTVLPREVDPSAILLSLRDLSPGENDITFRISDWLGNVAPARSKIFTLRACVPGFVQREDSASTPPFSNGSRQKTCLQDGSAFGDWVLTCDVNYHANASSDQCESNTRNCPVDVSLPEGVTVAIQTWDSSSSPAQWQACTATECETTHTLYEGTCYANTQRCDIEITVSKKGKDQQKVVGSGQKTYRADAQYSDCQVIACMAGYDAYDVDGNLSSTTCSKTEVGYFSSANDKGRTACSSNPAMPSVNAHWVGAGLAREADCEWECNAYYKKKTPTNDACVPEEAITKFQITGLVGVGSRKVTSSKTLQLEIAGTNIDRWYVTHTPTGTGNRQFLPTTTGDVEAGLSLSWTVSGDSPPITYTLPPSLPDGDYTLSVYGADVAGNVKLAPKTFDFYIDTTPPVLTIGNPPANPQIGGSVAEFDVSATDLAGATITYGYCFGADEDCGVKDDYTIISVLDDSSTVSIDLTVGGHNTFGPKIIHFGVEDDVGNTHSEKYQWTYHLCVGGDIKIDNTFQHGLKQGTCENTGERWGDDEIVRCHPGYYVDSTDHCVQVTEGAGFYADGVSKNRVSCANAITDEPASHFVWTNPAGSNLVVHCTWACERGYVKNGGVPACEVPSAKGKYAHSSGTEKDCEDDGGLNLPSDADWVDIVGGLTKKQACDFTCRGNKIKTNQGSTRTCTDPGPGVFVVAGVGSNCWPKGSNSLAELAKRGGASAWTIIQLGVTKANDCKLMGCTPPNRVLNREKTKCVLLPDRHYKKADSTKGSCGKPHASVHGWANDQTGVGQLSECKIDCGRGAVPVVVGATGSTAQCEQTCDPSNAPGGSGRRVWDTDTKAWSTVCQMTVCNAGFDDHQGGGVCLETEAGYYAEGNHRINRQPCAANANNGNIKKPGSYASWMGTGLTRVSDCRWACDKGYKLDSQGGGGTTCILKVPAVTRVEVQGLTDIGNGKKGTQDQNLTVNIVATEVTGGDLLLSYPCPSSRCRQL